MIFRMELESGHGAANEITDAVVAYLPIPSETSLSEYVAYDAQFKMESQKALQVCAAFFDRGRFLTVEIDTTKGTCTAVAL